MKTKSILSTILAVAAAGALAQGAERAATGRTSGVAISTNAKPIEQGTSKPSDFGVSSDAVSTFHFSAFRPVDSTFGFASDLFAEWPTSYGSGPGTIFYANLQVPEGAVIDYVKLNVCNTSGSTPALVFGLSQNNGDFADVGVANVAGCATFASNLLSYQIPQNEGSNLDFFVNWFSTPVDGSVKIAFGEVWWHRSVSPDPPFATFADVPVGHPQHRFIEALHAAGITAGCGGGNFCPDQPLTRGQEAVFISVALGLFWPNP